MPIIKVKKPFALRLQSGEKIKFPIGTHEVSEETLKHWFVKACLDEGRAILLGDISSEDDDFIIFDEETLLTTTNRELKKFALALNKSPTKNMLKKDLVALILDGKEKISLKKSPEGAYEVINA